MFAVHKIAAPRIAYCCAATLSRNASYFAGIITNLPGPSHKVMPGAKPGDKSPSTENVSGYYMGGISGDPTLNPLPDGEGVMKWDNEVIYSGSWKLGKYHGFGSKVHSNGGGYRGNYRDGLRHGSGMALYGGKWGYDRWEGKFVNDLEQDDAGIMFMTDGSSQIFAFDRGELSTSPPCNEEYEKSVFFRRLDKSTTDETIMRLLSRFGPLDYCYIARSQTGESSRIGRAKFRPVAEAGDSILDKADRIMAARQRAVDNADACCANADKMEVDGSVIRVEKARPVDMKEFTRYGDY